MSMGPLSWNFSARSFVLALITALAVSRPAPAEDRIDCSSFQSKILQHAIRYCVMLPPSYESGRNRKYPVLYFLHGLGQNEQALILGGGWGLIEDLRRQHRLGDFLIVAPEGHGSFFINAADDGPRYGDFFLTEFMPYVETHFRVQRGRCARGITGLSMGGYGALRMAFAHPELFGSVSAQSPALITQTPAELNHDFSTGGAIARLLGQVFGNPINLAHWRQNSPFELVRTNAAGLRRQSIYINCGKQDEYGFADGASKLHRTLMAERVQHQFHLYPGTHSAEYFLSHLGETLQFHSQTFGLCRPDGTSTELVRCGAGMAWARIRADGPHSNEHLSLP
jgi:S-formylglutathione hydrolase FrmB